MSDASRFGQMRIFGRHIMGNGPRTCSQQISIVNPAETLATAEHYTKDISVRQWSAEMMIAESAFGRMIYDRSRADHVADALITLAGQIRKANR